MRDEVTEVLLEAEKGGGKSLRRRQWGVFWVLGLVVYGRMLVKEIAGVAVRRGLRRRLSRQEKKVPCKLAAAVHKQYKSTVEHSRHFSSFNVRGSWLPVCIAFSWRRRMSDVESYPRCPSVILCAGSRSMDGGFLPVAYPGLCRAVRAASAAVHHQLAEPPANHVRRA